jgi:catechol 2,3-dioxygenase-like lactoylglutathione lyase family enzyme
VSPKTLDHVAVWLTDRDRVAGFLSRYVGMHVIERTERFTLVGSDARRGKLTLFEAEAPRERGALKHVALRVNSLDRARAQLPAGTGEAVGLGEGLELLLVEAPTPVDYDLDHVALLSPDPEEAASRYRALGFARAAPGPSGAPRVDVSGAWVELHEGDPGDPEEPLLHHLAVLVDSAADHREEAERVGIGVVEWVDAPNTLAVFLQGPDGVRVEYVEHKPTFSLV